MPATRRQEGTSSNCEKTLPRPSNDWRGTRGTAHPTGALDRVGSIAAMRAPISVPARGKAAADHGAGDIARAGRRAEGGGAGAAGPAARDAAHGRTAHEDMSGPVPPLRRPEQADEMIARRDRVGVRAGVPRTAAAVHFACGHAREAYMRPFRAPYRAIAVPDRDGGAGEGLAGRNDRGEQEQAEHHPIRNADEGSIQIARRSKTNTDPARSALTNRALGEVAARRRARGPGGRPPSGKLAEPIALRGPR